MYNCFKPKRVANEPATVILDLDFRVTDCTEAFTRLTGYTLECLKGECVSKLMTYFVKITHEKLFKRLRNSKKIETFKALDIEIEFMRKMRFINIVTLHGNIIKCKADFSYDYVNIFINFEKVTRLQSPHIVDKSHLTLMNDEPKFSIGEYNNYISILFDVKDSTKLVQDLDSKQNAEIYHTLIKIVTDKINKKYTPYARIHETCGDSIYIYVKPCESQSSMALLLAMELSRLMNRYLSKYNTHIRCGVDIGDLSGGIIDGRTFRMFGKSINLAQRLESVCGKCEVVISQDIFAILPPEDQSKFTTHMSELKGFGDVSYYKCNTTPQV